MHIGHVMSSCMCDLAKIRLSEFLWCTGGRRLSDNTLSPEQLVTWCQRWDTNPRGIPRPKPVEQPDRAGFKMAAGPYTLPPPAPLEIHSDQAGEKWKRFKRAWDSYTLATGLSEKAEDVQVATLLTVIGEEAREVYSTFTGWEHADDHKRIQPVLEQFERYCELRKNIPFEHYRFNRRCQEAGESYDQYRTALRKLAEICDFGSIIMRDRLVFGIRDSKTRERLLREPALTLKRTDELAYAANYRTLPIIGNAWRAIPIMGYRRLLS